MREKEFTKEGSFWGRDDMVKRSLDRDKKAGMIKFNKREKGVGDHGATVHKDDKKRIAKLKKDGYSQDHDYYNENLADMAQKVEQDHEIQLARAELYKAAKYSIKLHDMMKTMSEEEGLDGWVSAKITKASDYLSTVFHHLDYQTKFDSAGVIEGREDNPAPDMNKYGIHTTKFKGEPFKVFQHNKQIGKFDSIEEVDKFLTDLVNKPEEPSLNDLVKQDAETKGESYKVSLHNKLEAATATAKVGDPPAKKIDTKGPIAKTTAKGASHLGVTVGSPKTGA